MPNKLLVVLGISYSTMAKHRCNFRDREQKVLSSLYELVKGLNQKVDYVIEGQQDLYYRFRPESSYQ